MLFVDCFGGRHRSVPISSRSQPQLDQRFVCRALEAVRIQQESQLRKEEEKSKRRAQLAAETPTLAKRLPTNGVEEKAEDGKKDEKKAEEKKLLAERMSEWNVGGGFFG